MLHFTLHNNGLLCRRTIMKDLFNLTSLSGPSGWQENEAKELGELVQRRLHHLQVINLVVK